ncbi:hypothetical protein DUW29_22190 [Salmonella enterica subsp. enterica serovar Stanley]|nr:hypothetical protein [Salmonella enterica subsp. enterica serovar Stanley]
MKLIDLLVKELPKRGGWPGGVSEIGQDYDGELMFYGRGNARTRIYLPLSSDHRDMCCHNGDKVTKDRYESALAASQNPAWNGEGIPPVGCECEFRDNNGEWYPVTIKYASDQLVVISGITKILGVEQGTEITKDIIIDKPKFRPLRTEAERKREIAVNVIKGLLMFDYGDDPRVNDATFIYDAIAAGKIPGVKLDD